MNYEDNPKSIKYHVKKFILHNRDLFKNKKVIDVPAGTGITSRLIKEAGGIPIAFDLFPEYFKTEGITCERANIIEGLPIQNSSADILICQEGIEHFSDQYLVLKEFNRVLTKQGKLIITTPNYSNLQSRFSYLMQESERFNKIMPPNEIDSIWMSDQVLSKEIYFGHIFLIGIQKLRVLAKLAGFRIKQIVFVRAKTTSIILMFLFYPLIFITSWLTYFKNIRKKRKVSELERQQAKKVYKEVLHLSINPRILIDGHLFIVFEKEVEVHEVVGRLTSQHANFDIIT